MVKMDCCTRNLPLAASAYRRYRRGDLGRTLLPLKVLLLHSASEELISVSRRTRCSRSEFQTHSANPRAKYCDLRVAAREYVAEHFPENVAEASPALKPPPATDSSPAWPNDSYPHASGVRGNLVGIRAFLGIVLGQRGHPDWVGMDTHGKKAYASDLGLKSTSSASRRRFFFFVGPYLILVFSLFFFLLFLLFIFSFLVFPFAFYFFFF